jgi:hypothetical protein
LCAYKDPKWYSSQWSVAKWKEQFSAIPVIPQFSMKDLEVDDVRSWRFKPFSAGRPKAHARTEAVEGKKQHKCSACGKLGHKARTCEDADMDRLYATLSQDLTSFVEPNAVARAHRADHVAQVSSFVFIICLFILTRPPIMLNL